MTYLQILNLIRDTALAQPNVNTVVREFVDLNREDTKYSAVVIQDRDGEYDRIVENGYHTYTWHIGYVDRLTYDESNRDDIFSTGIIIINNIVNSIRNTYFPTLEIDLVDKFNTFNQRFTASCAGVYVVLAVNVQVSDCTDSAADDMYGKFETKIIENGEYHFVPDGKPVNEINITVDTPEPKPEEHLVETVTSNGVHNFFPSEGSVFSDAAITVSVPTDKPEETLSETITSNGSYSYSPTPGSVFSSVALSVDIHPERALIDTVTLNNTEYQWPGDWRGVKIWVDVHPSQSLVETITSNGSYHYTGEWKDAEITVSVSQAKPEETLSETITSNGSYSYSPTPGSVFSSVALSVDVHPSNTLSRTYTANGTKTITGEFNGGTINVNVHPSLSLSETYYSNGTYTISNENAGGTITVLVPDGELPVPADDEIYYLTYTGNPIVLYNSSDFGANLVSNTYQNGYGILKFDGPISRTGSSSFYSRIGLKKVVLPYSVTEISYSSFANTGLQDVIMQNTVASIGDSAFSGCFAITTPFKISSGCEFLYGNSFKDCTAITTITITGRCKKLETGVFKGCSHLFNIYCNAAVPPVMDLNTVTNTYDQFEGCRQDFIIRVPAGSVQAYQTATGWSDYASRIVSQ